MIKRVFEFIAWWFAIVFVLFFHAAATGSFLPW